MCKESKILLLISALFTFAIGLSGIFINVFFWKQTNNFKVIVIYNLIHYIATPIFFIVSGVIAKRKNGAWSLRIGLVIFALFYALILLLGNKGNIYIYLLGFVYGMATGFYWLAFNTLCFDFTSINNRDTFNGFNGSCAGVAAAVAPITSAYIISTFKGMKGYNIVFAITLLIFVILVFISMLLRCKSYGSRLDLKKSFKSDCREWGIVRKTTVLWGFRDVTIVFVINILILETTKSELSIGKFALIGALISSASYILVQKLIKPRRRRLSITIGTIGSFLAVTGLILRIDNRMLLLYVVLDALFLPFFIIQLSSSTFNVIDKAHENDMRVEYMINKDIAINTGRIISSIILLILLTTSEGLSSLKIYLAFIGLMPIIAAYFLRRLKGLDGSCQQGEKSS